MVTNQEAELNLLQRIQAKDSSALAELIDLYGAALNGIVQRILRSLVSMVFTGLRPYQNG